MGRGLKKKRDWGKGVKFNPAKGGGGAEKVLAMLRGGGGGGAQKVLE